MRKKILFIILVASILIIGSKAMALKPDIPPGLSEEKNINALGQLKKSFQFESQRNFVDEVHSRILERLDQKEVSPLGLTNQVDESLPPVAIITWNTPVYRNTAVLFYADTSYDPDGGEITLIEWDINGNGNYEISNINPYPGAYIYSGTYQIGLRVTDDEGQTGTIVQTVNVLDLTNN